MMYKNETVNVIMPVYNEQDYISEILNRVLAQKFVDRVIVIDDNSKDKSAQIIKGIAKKDKRISLLSNESNMGKGYGVRKGLEKIKKGIVIIQDADLEYYPEDYKKLLDALEKDTFVLGTRVRKKETGHTYGLAKFANAAFTFEFNLLYGTRLTDINTCYKIFRKEMLEGAVLKENDFLIDPEILVTLIRKGYKTKEVDIRYKGRTYEQGKKINSVDAVKQFLFIITSKTG
jgi:glycosyltransferase involved in cell wall biosynthesis